MSITVVGANANTVTNNGVTLTEPSGLQGQDVVIAAISSLDSTFTDPATGFSRVDAQAAAGLYGVVSSKVAPGTVGSGSSDASASVVYTPAVLGAGHKSAAVLIALRGASASSPVNAHVYIAPATGGTSFAGAAVTTTVDGCTIVSIFMDKDSTNPLDVTPPAGYTVPSGGSAVFTTGSGKANCVIATKTAGAAGSYGGDTWTTDAIPGSVEIYTIAIAPVSTTQTLRPTGDVGTPSGVTGVTVNTSGNLYQNIDESSLSTSDYNEFIVTGDYTESVSTLNSPGVNTGFSVTSVFGLGSGVSSTTWTVTLKQSTTTIESWSVTVTSDGQVDTHAVSSSNIASITYTSGQAANLRVEYQMTAAS